MDTFATLPATEREVYCQQAAANLGLPPQVIEKDFWVCWTLKRLFALKSVGDDLLFKGGTSLSKAHGIIRRFSEDIDLSIHRGSLGFEGENDPAHLKGKPFKKTNAALSAAARAKIFGEIQPEMEGVIRDLLGVEGWRLEQDESDPEGQSLAFFYPVTGLTPDPAAYLRPAVKIEFGARADHEPSERKPVRPYLVEAIPDALDESTTEVKVISAVRTFWEKATILHQMAHLAPEKNFPARYSRHYCDLAAMIEHGTGAPAARDKGLLADVVAHKIAFYAAKWASYETAASGTLRLVPPVERHGEIARDLESMREMFFDTPPKIEAVIATLAGWEADFNQNPEI
ncbi:MAG: nucleotidyl transferase AbiEii/AbiGii toxin family protein [Verrucomicrobiales bacterium]